MSANLMSLARSGGKFLKLFGDRKMMKPLPYDAEVEYLESTGTQFIDTLISPDASTIWRLTCASTNESLAFIGAIDVSATRFHFSLYDNGVVRGCMGKIQSTIGSPDLAFHVLELDAVNKRTGMDGVYVPCEYHEIPYLPIWLFGRNSDNYTFRRMVSVKTSASQIWKSGVLVCDHIPVRVGDVGYLYDRVSGSLFGNSGTGAFIIGPDKTI